MEKQNIINFVKGTCPQIDNLSERTWDEVAEALESIIFRDTAMKEAIIKVFKTISGQIRHDVSEQLKKVTNQETGTENNRFNKNI